MSNRPRRPDLAAIATVIADCPKCKQPVNLGRHQETGSMIVHCPRCNTHFPDAAGTKRLIDTNVVNGWNVYAELQRKLEAGEALNQTDFSAAFGRIRAAITKP